MAFIGLGFEAEKASMNTELKVMIIELYLK